MSALVKSIPSFGSIANPFAIGTAGAVSSVMRNFVSPADGAARFGALGALLSGHASSSGERDSAAPLSSARAGISLNVIDPRNFEPRNGGQPPPKGVKAQGQRILDLLSDRAQFSVVLQLLGGLGIRRVVLVPRYHRNFTVSVADEESVKTLMANYRVAGLEAKDAVIAFDPEYAHSMHDSALAMTLEHELWHAHDALKFPQLYKDADELISGGAISKTILRSVLHLYLRVSAQEHGRASFVSADIADQRRLGRQRMERASGFSVISALLYYIGDVLETSYAHMNLGNRWRAHYSNWRLKATYGKWVSSDIDRRRFFDVGDRLLGLVMLLIADRSGSLKPAPPLADMDDLIDRMIMDADLWKGILIG